MSTTQPHRIFDVNGKLTTVYKRPETASQLPNRLSKVAPPSQTESLNTELNSYASGRYVSITAPQSAEDMKAKIAAAPDDESCLLMVSDSVLDSDGSLDINGGGAPVLVHLDALRTAKINVRSGEVAIKTYSDSHIPVITVSNDAHVTVIISEGTGADVVLEGASTSTIVPESGAFGTVYVQGDNAAVLDDSMVKHQMLILG